MKAILKWLVTFMVMFVSASVFQAKAQTANTFNPSDVFNWTQNLGDNGGTVLTTPSITNSQNVATVLDFTTSWTLNILMNNGNLNIERQNISPTGPNASSAYYAGPVSVQTGGTVVKFSVWLNPSAQPTSSESIYNISVNGISLSETITANSASPYAEFLYTSPTPVAQILLNYQTTASAGGSESGMGINLRAPVVIPEPTTLSLIALAGAIAFIAKRKKLQK